MPLDFLSNPERLRYESVPTLILEQDIRHYFYLTRHDQRFLLNFRGINRLGVALQIGLIQYMGYLPERWTSQLPSDVIRFVANQINQSDQSFANYSTRLATHTEHLAVVLQHLLYRKWEPMDAAHIEPWLLERALEHDNEHTLLVLICQKLHQQKILRPAIGTL